LEAAQLGSFLDTAVGELSGGLRHAATLACVLHVAPNALLLDEPASDLDTSRKDALWRVLTEASKSLEFLIMASHEKDMPAFLQKRVTLVDGRIL